mmetsp:Transcript_73374/g.159105  ORF Transcript_73374/g.159105 Transcript_73374/m.159105 type:complete len:85 (-) Transcript_73374:100-354(-)
MTWSMSLSRLSFVLALAVLTAAQKSGTSSEKASSPLMITPNGMTALIVGLFLWVPLFLAGFCCLFSVQTPCSFEEKCLTMNKQY